MIEPVSPLDVPCSECNALAGVRCRAWTRMLEPTDRVHRARAQRRNAIEQMHRAARALFGTWPLEDEVEFLARLGEGEERERATKLLSLIEATGYEGELFCTT